MPKPIKVTAAQARRLQRNLKGNEAMSQDELMKNVRAKLASKQVITTYFIQQHYRVLQSQARKCIDDLQKEGLISKVWDPSLGGYPVLSKETVTF